MSKLRDLTGQTLANPKSFHSVYSNKATEQDFYKWLGGSR